MARVYDKAQVYDEAEVYGCAQVLGYAQAFGKIWLNGTLIVCSSDPEGNETPDLEKRAKKKEGVQ